MVTWKKTPLKKKTFIPKILHDDCVKSVQLQHFLILFNFEGRSSEEIVVLDLKESKWLKTRVNGDELELKSGSSFCCYDNNTVIMFGVDVDQTVDILNILTFNKGSDCLKILCYSLTK